MVEDRDHKGNDKISFYEDYYFTATPKFVYTFFGDGNCGLLSFDGRFVDKNAKTFNSFGDGRAWIKKYLISCGYSLLTQEQYKKLLVLK